MNVSVLHFHGDHVLPIGYWTVCCCHWSAEQEWPGWGGWDEGCEVEGVAHSLLCPET